MSKSAMEDGSAYNALVDQAYLAGMKKCDGMRPWNMARLAAVTLLGAMLVSAVLLLALRDSGAEEKTSALLGKNKNPGYDKELKALLHEKMERELRYLKEAALETAEEIELDKKVEDRKAKVEEEAHKAALAASKVSEKWLHSHPARKPRSKLTPEEEVERVLKSSKEQHHREKTASSLARNASIAVLNTTKTHANPVLKEGRAKKK